MNSIKSFVGTTIAIAVLAAITGYFVWQTRNINTVETEAVVTQEPVEVEQVIPELDTAVPPTVAPTEVISTNTPLPAEPPTNVFPTETPTPNPTRERIMVKTFEDVQYGNTENHRLDVYQPQVDEQSIPVLLLIGGWDVGKFKLQVSGDYYARQGYNVVTYNTGSGTYPRFEQDAFCALAWIHANAEPYGFDTERIVPVGFLSGGTHAALLATVDDPGLYMEDCPNPLPEEDLIRAAISVNGLFDWSIWNQSDDNKWDVEIYPYFDPPDGRLARIVEASPITYVDGNEPPIFLFHGKDEEVVDKTQSEMFAAQLTEAGVEVELLIQEGLIYDFGYVQDILTLNKVARPIKEYLIKQFSE